MKTNTIFLRRFLKGHRRYFLLAFFFLLLNTACFSCIPQLLKLGVDQMTGEISGNSGILQTYLNQIGSIPTRLSYVAGGVILLALVQWVAQLMHKITLAKGAEGLIEELRTTLYQHVMAMPYLWHASISTGDLIQRCTSDVEVVRGFLSRQLLSIFRILLLVCFSVGMMVSMNGKITLVAVAFIPVLLGFSLWFYHHVGERFLKVDEAEGRMTIAIQENITGAKVVKAFGRESYEVENFQRKNREYVGLWESLGRSMCLYWATGDFISGLQVLSVICLGTIATVRHQISLGTFLALLSYNSMLIWPIRELGRVLSDMSKCEVSIKRLDEILQAKTEELHIGGPRPSFKAPILLEDVCFSYGGDNLVLDHISLEMPPGTVTAIVGETGSGKSTLAHILCGLIAPTSGRVLVGDTDMAVMDKTYLRQKVGIVLQEPFLYSRSIGENLCMGKSTLKREEMDRVCQAADIYESILHFSEGYKTSVGERGVTLSGGQKQRVAIARMLAQDPALMILDDALSAVDTKTDRKIRKALEEEMTEKTVLIIAHRMTTILQADNVVVLKQGRVIQQGPPAMLLREKGEFQYLYRLQLGKEDN